MEIDGKDPLAGLNSSVQRLDIGQQQTLRVPKSGDSNPGAGSDRVELSVQSREALYIDGLINSTPDIRQSRVDQLRSAIANGTYNVKGEKVAEKIINGNWIDEVS